MPFDLINFIGSLNIANPERIAAQCEKLRLLLIESNKSVNLTRITSVDDFNIKHAADSLALVKVLPELTAGKRMRLADIGCGAGFPSLVLAIAFPQLQITAIDSTGKKIAFVSRAAEELRLNNLQAIQGRAVELNCKPEFQAAFDIVTARAVAPSPKLYRETTRFPKAGGRWIFFKTPGQAAEEMADLQKLPGISWQISSSFEVTPESGERVFITGNRR